MALDLEGATWRHPKPAGDIVSGWEIGAQTGLSRRLLQPRCSSLFHIWGGCQGTFVLCWETSRVTDNLRAPFCQHASCILSYVHPHFSSLTVVSSSIMFSNPSTKVVLCLELLCVLVLVCYCSKCFIFSFQCALLSYRVRNQGEEVLKTLRRTSINRSCEL